MLTQGIFNKVASSAEDSRSFCWSYVLATRNLKFFWLVTVDKLTIALFFMYFLSLHTESRLVVDYLKKLSGKANTHTPIILLILITLAVRGEGSIVIVSFSEIFIPLEL